MLRRRSQDEREHGQIIVLFALCLVVILAFSAIVVDIGMLRNDRQNLANAMDAAALAGGTQLPVTGAAAASKIESLIDATVSVNYRGLTLPTIANGGITFRCLIGTLANGTPDYTQITPNQVCDPTHALGHTPGPGFPNDFTGAGPTRSSNCRPDLGDKCNVVLVAGAATQAYGFARIIGINSGSTATVQSAACNGPCGAPPVAPVDLVVILDRTGSMTENNGNTRGTKIQSLQAAARAVLSVYDPSLQRVALGLTGPGEVDASGAPYVDSCGGGAGSALGVNDDGNFTARANLTAKISTKVQTTVSVSGPYTVGFPKSGNFTIVIDDEQMQVTGGQGTNNLIVTRGFNGSTAATHSNGTEVDQVDPWVPDFTVGHNTVGMWIPVGLSGTDTTTVSALPNPSGVAGTYSIGGVVQNNSTIVKAINCIQAASNGTNLSTPIKMAQAYLDKYGRKGVTQGIILETDGHPQVGFNGGNQWQTNAAYTCKAAIEAAAAAKADTTNSAAGIQIFTVGYGVDSTSRCPIFTNNTNFDDGTYNMYEGTDTTSLKINWSNVQASTLLRDMATDGQHYFDNPPSSQLAAVFTQAAQILSHSGLHLIQPYPAPIVQSLAPAAGLAVGNTSVTVTGEFFTGATNVQIGGTPVGFTVVNDTTITFKTPPGTKGKTVDVIVTTGGGSSPPTAGDQFTYN